MQLLGLFENNLSRVEVLVPNQFHCERQTIFLIVWSESHRSLITPRGSHVVASCLLDVAEQVFEISVVAERLAFFCTL